MDWLITAEGRAARRARTIAGLSEIQLRTIVSAADAFIVAGLCGDPQQQDLDWLLWKLREAGLADS